jgi:hypothetical protein
MKTAASLICFAVTGFCQTASQLSLTVCMQPYGQTLQARDVASKIYAGIGVKLVWHMDFKNCPERAVRIELSETTPERLKPGALAYAMPFADAAIVVFYDRILESAGGNKRFSSKLMGHVFAHEIGHVLERIDRHSAAGVMKAHWTSADFVDIAMSGLKFARIDTTLVLEGVEDRSNSQRIAAALK